jgi:V/A-type H+-transporting ATPase subunit D
MGKIKLTKGELKKQRDDLRRFERYLPTLQLKKQQLQMEILHWNAVLQEKQAQEKLKTQAVLQWAGLLADPGVELAAYFRLERVVTSAKNIAGVDVPVFGSAEFKDEDYDLFLVPAWVDSAIEHIKELMAVRAEIAVEQQAVAVLQRELRITAQRVNLFEKVKIPEALEAIRRIKISIGDQMANAVGRSKAAKRKIEALFAAGVAV